MSCRVCNGLQEASSWRQASYHELCHSSAAGCSSCSILFQGVLSHVEFPGDIESIAIEGRSSEPSPNFDATPLVVEVNRKDETNIQLEFYRKPGARPTWPEIGVCRDVSRHSASEACFSLARRWLLDCINNHKNCPGMRLCKLPTRVLDLGYEAEYLRLYESNGEKALYAALSHCWGSRAPYQLKTTNHREFQRRMLIATLPQTFKDAIAVARRLDVRYLWIDSLCIIQDDVSDWEKESSQMSSIYTNSLFTIAADCASDSHSGFFANRNPSDTDPLEIIYPDAYGSNSSVFVRRERIRPYPYANHFTNPQPLRSGLHSRAWIFQERLLSSRTLHYTATELAWECATGIACECRVGIDDCGRHLAFKRAFVHPDLDQYGFFLRSIQGVSGSVNDAQIQKIRDRLSLLPEEERRKQVSLVVQLHWQLVVYEFTARKLTVDTDRLPALSGIVDAICRVTSKKYLFGIWLDEIVRGLLWHSIDYKAGVSTSHRLREGYAPTWSWASVTGRIYHHPEEDYLSFYPRLVVEKTAHCLSSPNPYGPGTGTITVYGCLVPVYIPLTKRAPDGSARLFVTDDNLQSTNPPYDYPSNCVWGYFDPDVKGDGDGVCSQDTHFFLICAIASREAIEDGWILGVILKARPLTSDPIKYARVGFVLGSRSFSLEQWEAKGKVQRVDLV